MGQQRRQSGVFMTILLSGLLACGLVLASGEASSQPQGAKPPQEQRKAIALVDAVLRSLEANLDISISRKIKESRVADIIGEQAKFDPTLSLNGQYNRAVQPLNRPVFGGTGQALQDIQTFDQRNHSLTLDMTQNLLTGANYDLNYSPSRSNINRDVAGGFLFNPAYSGGLAFTLTQPLLRNFGTDINRTFIQVARNNAKIEEHVFLDRVLTVIATVEQNFWELVFVDENLKVAESAHKAAQELLASNRAKAKAGIMSIVDVLQAEAAVASRVEQAAPQSHRRGTPPRCPAHSAGQADPDAGGAEPGGNHRRGAGAEAGSPASQEEYRDGRPERQVRQEPDAPQPVVPGHLRHGRPGPGRRRHDRPELQR
jgi:outer membrane protein TolC